jgi:Protein of unknown function (DUF1552)
MVRLSIFHTLARKAFSMSTTPSTPPSRRQFLRSSAALLGLPWLESLAAAAEPAPPRRLVFICTSFGLYGPAFFPQQAGRDYVPSAYLKILEGLREQFTVFSGIAHPDMGGEHASDACFLTSAKQPLATGFRNTVSVDFVAARHVGNATRFPFLSLGGGLTYTFSGAAVPGLSKPADVFARLFLAGKPKDVEQELARLKRGRSVLDGMGERFAALKTRLSAHDQQQVADYTEAVRDMEKQLQASEAWVVRPKPEVKEAIPKDVDMADIIGRARLMFNLTRLALQTDSTRVVSVMIKGMDLRPPIEGVTQDHHGLTHHDNQAAKIEQLQIVERAEMTAFRDFLVSLQDAKEGDSSLLEQTQVLFGSNLGDAAYHGTSNLPILLAGGGHRHGQHIAGDRNNNTPLAKLFVSMLQRFGVETDTFGSGMGTIGGLVPSPPVGEG